MPVTVVLVGILNGHVLLLRLLLAAPPVPRQPELDLAGSGPAARAGAPLLVAQAESAPHRAELAAPPATRSPSPVEAVLDSWAAGWLLALGCFCTFLELGCLALALQSKAAVAIILKIRSRAELVHCNGIAFDLGISME